LEKASKLFDKVIVAIGNNPEKKGLVDLEQIKSAIPFYEVTGFYGMLSDYIKSVETYAKVTLVRGLRNGYDLEYEANQLRFIEDMYDGNISVVFIPCSREHSYISSSSIRAINAVEPSGKFSKRYLL
jgi:phosphopantetheine adenylyltransferase